MYIVGLPILLVNQEMIHLMDQVLETISIL